jgi:hypothetical protein
MSAKPCSRHVSLPLLTLSFNPAKGIKRASCEGIHRRVRSLVDTFPPAMKRKEETRHRNVGSSDAYDSGLSFATSFAITDVRLVAPVMCSVPGTPK